MSADCRLWHHDCSYLPRSLGYFHDSPHSFPLGYGIAGLGPDLQSR